jgi:hypothetical protein
MEEWALLVGVVRPVTKHQSILRKLALGFGDSVVARRRRAASMQDAKMIG